MFPLPSIFAALIHFLVAVVCGPLLIFPDWEIWWLDMLRGVLLLSGLCRHREVVHSNSNFAGVAVDRWVATNLWRCCHAVVESCSCSPSWFSPFCPTVCHFILQSQEKGSLPLSSIKFTEISKPTPYIQLNDTTPFDNWIKLRLSQIVEKKIFWICTLVLAHSVCRLSGDNDRC